MLLQPIQDALLGLGLSGLATSTVYAGLVVRACLSFAHEQCQSCSTALVSAPPVSVLKPLHGTEPDLDLHLESFFTQQYPVYEILFCAHSADDPGLQVARRVAARYPRIPARFLTSGELSFANAKVASLETMYQAARHDLLIVSDSDVHVASNYLRQVVSPFASKEVGAVTCLYRGVVAGRGNSVWAYLEGVGMSIEMPAGVLVARMIEGMQFLLGPTMAVRRSCVQEIGGFRALGPYCSDDFLLGKWIEEKGHTIVLSQHVVDHVILNTGFMDSVQHQVRWMKSTRCSRPKGHFGTALTFGMPFALLAATMLLRMRHSTLAVITLASGILIRMLLAAVVGGAVVKERHLWRTILLNPLRDFMGFGYWLASYTNNRILWRGKEYELLEEGLMRPVHASQPTIQEDQQPALTH